MIRSQTWQERWWQLCLSGVACTGLLAGCVMPQTQSDKLADKIKPATSASYQEVTIDEGPPKKVNDPLSLKLRYAQWMEEIENYPEAETHYNVILQQRPQDIDALLGLARIDQMGGRTTKAEAGFKKALSLRPQSTAAKNALGQFYVSQQRWTEAMPLLNEAVQSDPTNEVYRHQLAVALASSGDVNAAYPHFVKTVGDVAAHYNIGMILKKQGQYRQAEQQYLQALTKNPNFEPAKRAVTEVRQLATAADKYATQQSRSPQIQATAHQSTASPLTPAQQEQLRNQRAIR